MLGISLLLHGSALFSASLVSAQGPYATTVDSNGQRLPTYSPARPPAVPLAVRSPYTNAWSTTGSNGTLNSNNVMFWTNQTLGWEGIVRVDGVAYEWLGAGTQSLPALPNLKSAVPLTVSYDSQYSNFTFAAGPIELTASFLSSVLPTDYCRTSIPLSYLTVTTKSTDFASHDVQLYNDVNGAWISHDPGAILTWNIYEDGAPVNGTNVTASDTAVYTWMVALQKPYEFGEDNQFPQWGNFTFTSSQGVAQRITFQSGFSATLRYSFVNKPALSNFDDANYRGFGRMDPAFAYAHELGRVGPAGSVAVTYTLGSVQQPLIKYLSGSGLVPLQPWWTTCYGDIFQMIDFHYHDLGQTQVLAGRFENQLKLDVDRYYHENPAPVVSSSRPSSPPPYPIGTQNGTAAFGTGTDQFGTQYVFDPDTAYGFLSPNTTCFATGIAIPDVSEAESYYSIVALSTRQIMAAYVLTLPPANTGCGTSGSLNQGEPLMFQKEISSDGNVNTVDVMFPAMPFFLYANPELLRFNLEPLYQNEEWNFYPNSYSMHDLGPNFPNATGHVEGTDEYMPVEESGNMIIMTYAYYAFTNNAAFLRQHYAILSQWAQFLMQYSLIPGVQLSTDDFAGRLANQTNLAIKGIVGLKAMARIAAVVGNGTAAANFSATSAEYYKEWEFFAIDPSHRHTMLAYQWRSSYGLLYNTYPDKLLALGVVSQAVYDMQSAWYPEVSQIYGVPLDSRHDYTKSDWAMWTAATCSPSTRALFVNSIAYWLNETTTYLAFSDLYGTIDGGYYPRDPPIQFIARPVVGGHFSLLAMQKGMLPSAAASGCAVGSIMVPGTLECEHSPSPS